VGHSRALADTIDASRRLDLQEKRDRACPAVPAKGNEGVDGSSPSDGLQTRKHPGSAGNRWKEVANDRRKPPVRVRRSTSSVYLRVLGAEVADNPGLLLFDRALTPSIERRREHRRARIGLLAAHTALLEPP
jgi:hypothetical protein